MTNVPRRLPPTQGQRIRNVTVTHASLSGQGRTASARPVPQQPASAQIYRPPSGGLIPDRASPLYAIADTSVMPASPFFLPEWTDADELPVGASLTVNSDGSVTLNSDGVYAVGVWLSVYGITAADPSCSVRLHGVVSSPYFVVFGCGVRGGDAPNSDAVFATAERTYFATAGTSVSLQVSYANLDPAVVTRVLIEAQIQRIS